MRDTGTEVSDHQGRGNTMGYVVRADVDLIDGLALGLDRAGAELVGAADHASRAWRLVAGAAGGGELATAADEAGRRWGASLDRTGRLSSDLAQLTREAARAYQDVEQTVARVWTTQTGMTGRRAAWTP